MKKTNVELIKFKKKYQNKWVAYDKETSKVLAYDEDLEKLTRKPAVRGKDYILEKVSPLNLALIP